MTEIDRLRARLDELEGQEAVGVVVCDPSDVSGEPEEMHAEFFDGVKLHGGAPLYTAPPAAVPDWLVDSLRIIERSASESGDRLPQSLASTCLQSLKGDRQ